MYKMSFYLGDKHKNLRATEEQNISTHTVALRKLFFQIDFCLSAPVLHYFQVLPLILLSHSAAFSLSTRFAKFFLFVPNLHFQYIYRSLFFFSLQVDYFYFTIFF